MSFIALRLRADGLMEGQTLLGTSPHVPSLPPEIQQESP